MGPPQNGLHRKCDRVQEAELHSHLDLTALLTDLSLKLEILQKQQKGPKMPIVCVEDAQATQHWQ
jgi:hypothetical protein